MQVILIAVDGSSHADNAVQQVIHWAKQGLNMELHLINVQPIMLPMGEFPDYVLIEKAQRQKSRHILDAAAKLLELAGLSYKKHHEIGPVAQTIVDFADAHNCSQIVMGTRGMSAIANLVIGSTANQVVHLAEVPVTLVK